MPSAVFEGNSGRFLIFTESAAVFPLFATISTTEIPFLSSAASISNSNPPVFAGSSANCPNEGEPAPVTSEGFFKSKTAGTVIIRYFREVRGVSEETAPEIFIFERSSIGFPSSSNCCSIFSSVLSTATFGAGESEWKINSRLS